jgi:hypothetical protein
MQYQPEIERPKRYPDNATPVTTRVKIFFSLPERIYGLVAKWKWIFREKLLVVAMTDTRAGRMTVYFSLIYLFGISQLLVLLN